MPSSPNYSELIQAGRLSRPNTGYPPWLAFVASHAAAGDNPAEAHEPAAHPLKKSLPRVQRNRATSPKPMKVACELGAEVPGWLRPSDQRPRAC